MGERSLSWGTYGLPLRAPPRLGGLLQRPRPRWHSHGRGRPDPLGGCHPRRCARRPDPEGLGFPLGAWRPHRHRPAKRRRAWTRRRTQAPRHHNDPHGPRLQRGPRVLEHLGQRASVRHASLLQAPPGPLPGAQRRRFVRNRQRRARYAARGEEDQGPQLETFLAGKGTAAEGIIVDILGSFDVEAHLRAGGLTNDDVVALRSRLVCP